jgi:hypothetical protein
VQSENHPLVILYGVFSGRAVLSIALTCTWRDSSVDLCHHSLSKVNRGSANEEAGRGQASVEEKGGQAFNGEGRIEKVCQA